MNAVGIPDAPSSARTAQQPAFRDGGSAVLDDTETAADAQLPRDSVDASRPTATLPLPTWDRDRLELRLGATVLRQFKIPSPQEEMILAALQEMNWPTRIDDPSPSHDNPLQLERTIALLNRRQRPPLIEFRLDGTCQGIVWEFSHAALKLDID